MLAIKLFEALEKDRDDLANKIGATSLDALKVEVRADKCAWEAAAAALEKLMSLMRDAGAPLWHSLDGFVQETNLKSADARRNLRKILSDMGLRDPAAYTVANRVLMDLGEPMPVLLCTEDSQVKKADPLGCLRLVAEYGNLQTLDAYFVSLASFALTARLAALLLREFVKQSGRLKTPPNAALSTFLKQMDSSLLAEALGMSPAFVSNFAPKVASRVTETYSARAPIFTCQLDEEANQRAEQAQQLWAA